MEHRKVLLSTAFFPPIAYFSVYTRTPEVLIEKQENYNKQSYRNRCVILTCNGPLTLIIPVKKTCGNNTPIHQIAIDESTPWRKIHWKAIESAYNNSAYFMYYADSIQALYTKKHHWLIDLNEEILQNCIRLLKIENKHTYTEEFNHIPIDCIDFRNNLHPKKVLPKEEFNFQFPEYYQVFNDKFPFQKNLSILDLLFNEGKMGIDLL